MSSGSISSFSSLHPRMENPTSTCSSFTQQAVLPNWQLYFAYTERWFAAKKKKKKVKMQEQENCVNGVWLYPKPSNTAGVGAPSDVFAWRTPTWNGWWISIFGQMAEFPNPILKYTLSLLRNCTFLLWRLLFTWKIHSSILMVSIATTGNLNTKCTIAMIIYLLTVSAHSI